MHYHTGLLCYDSCSVVVDATDYVVVAADYVVVVVAGYVVGCVVVGCTLD